MATIPGDQKIRTIDASVDMTERGSALINSKSEVYTMDDIIETVGGGALPILTEYPNTDATKVGQKFIYKNRLYQYLTSAQITAMGFRDVAEGTPCIVDFVYDLRTLITTEDSSAFASYTNTTLTSSLLGATGLAPNIELNFMGLGNPLSVQGFDNSAGQIGTVTSIIGAEFLQNLEDVGTTVALNLRSAGMSAEVIDSLFTQLPSTEKTATINVSTQPGAATCDPTIATSKGYTVIA
jgi:hypothetical protein